MQTNGMKELYKKKNFSVLGLACDVYAERELLRELVKREISGKYKGSAIGLMWVLINPLLMLTMYVIVFGYVFKGRWGGLELNGFQYASFIFAGLIVHGFASECLVKAPVSLVNNPNYVKKIVFPTELLCVVPIASAIFSFLINVGLLFIISSIGSGKLAWEVVFVILAAAPLAIMVIGISLTLSILGVYYRDTVQIVSFLSTILMYTAPVFYSLNLIPEHYRWLLYFNPITIPIESGRSALEHTPNYGAGFFLIYMAASFFILWLGGIVYENKRYEISDQL